MDALSTWLQHLGLEHYTAIFAESDVDLEALCLLTDVELEKLGVSLGHRKKLLKAIAVLSATEVLTPSAQSLGTGHTPREPINVDAERRQLTVMFCDLVGSTALAERLDPEELRDLMQGYQRACSEVVARYDGHVAQYLGDGLMVYFGWPRAHEDDAVRAIRAGLEMMESISKLASSTPLRARVGIHTGLVVVGETGQGDASIPKAAVGETPNIAARLQALAESGGVLVSERTRSLAGGQFDYADMGAHMLKGISEPVELFRVLRVRATESRFEANRVEGALTPLVGREEEIALLVRRWQQAQEGEGQVVLVGGEPGIGKSRLTRVLRERLGREPSLVLRYQCSPYHLNSALHPAIEQFEQAAGFGRDDTPAERLDKMQVLLAGSADQIVARAPLLASLLSLPMDGYPLQHLSPQKQKEQTLEALAGQIEALAQRQPLLMLWEDTHWIDATSQEFLDLLVPRLRHLPVLVVVTHRPESTARWTDQAHVTTLGLNRLGRRQGAELVAKLTAGKALPPEVLDQILAHTDGVPLFIEELTKSVLESRLLRETEGGYALEAPLPALAIPTTLRDSLIARLDRFAPVRELAQIGACIGREFPYELLAALSPVKGTALDEALEQLTKTGLVFRRGTPPAATYTFKHALVQDAAYDSLLKTKRTQLHAQIAQALEQEFSERVTNEPELLAHHFTRAGLNERAVSYWSQAGQRALARVALPEAVGHLTTALSINEQLPASIERDRRELDVRVMLGAAYLASRGWPALEIIQTLRPARDLAIRLGDEDQLVVILNYIFLHHATRCEFAKSLGIVAELDTLAQSREDSLPFLVARWLESSTHCWLGNFKHLVNIYTHDVKCFTLVWAGYHLWALGYPDQAKQATLQQLELARRLGHAFNLCVALTQGTQALTLCGETPLAQQWLGEANAIAREHAMTYFADGELPFWGGWALVEQGKYAEGYASLTTVQKGWRDLGGLVNIPFGNMMRARALMGLHRFAEAKNLLDEAIEIIDRTDQRIHEAEVYRVLGELQRQQPATDVHAAEAFFLKALEVSRSQDAKGWELRTAMSLARLWKSQDKRREAYEMLAPVYNWFTEGYDTHDLETARELLHSLRQ
jgi:class 3 adenylate cyclase/tetratricopeptide (TPR) repeat protein/ABC-type transport system involved in cytochrome c biogenesis ATPase subunit